MDSPNRAGVIPDLQIIKLEGRIVYYKKTNQMMGIFTGVGISQSLLDKQTKYDEVVINFYSDCINTNVTKHNGIYLATMEQFRKSMKTYDNVIWDYQRFVSFNDMKLIKKHGESQ